MKKVITIMVLAIATQFAMAHDEGSVLNLRLSDNSPFAVYVDGHRVGGIATRATLTNLSDGKHFLEVKSVSTFRGRGKKERAFKDVIRIKRDTESFATIDLDCNKIQFDRVIALNNRGWDKHDDRCNERDCRNPKHNHANMSDHYNTPVGPMPMNQNDFSQLKNTINNGSFESTKLTIFKQALAYNYFTSAQVREVMNLFWFENSKLEVAKLAYPKTLDQNNYYTLNNEFSFSSSINELGDYIAMR